MMSPSKYALPAGSLVLVSGANGYIASHIVDILLQLGFNVRGTIRTAKPWLDSFFQTKYGKPRYESVVVPAIEHDGSFDEAVKGVAGFIHVASDMSMDPDPDVVIPRTVKGTINALEASLKQSQVKRFVLTSSSTAAYVGQPNVEGVIIDEKSWNLTSLNIAMNKDTPIQMKGPHTYSASKTQQERTAWKWVEDNKPHFAFNAVLPNVNIGPILTPEIPGSVMGLVKNILNGDVTAMNMIRPQYFIDVRDTARLHVAALLDLDLQSTRIFAYAHALNWTDIISVMRKLKPDNDKIPQPPENEGRDLTEVMPRKRSEEILTAFFDRPGWTPLEETLSEAL